MSIDADFEQDGQPARSQDPTHTTYSWDIPFRQNPSAPGSDHDGRQSAGDQDHHMTEKPHREPSPKPVRSYGGEASTREGKPSISGGLKSEPARKNPEIKIPKISPAPTQQSPGALAAGLEGKYVDEFGNVLDWDGTVLGRVDGDLPSMIGRPVSSSGKVMDASGEVVGFVSENYTKPQTKPIGGGLSADAEGNIYDNSGAVVGKFNQAGSEGIAKPMWQDKPQEPDTKACSCAAPRPPVTPSPSEVYLDVKSTHDGIQLIIKIPTVFGNGQNCQK